MISGHCEARLGLCQNEGTESNRTSVKKSRRRGAAWCRTETGTFALPMLDRAAGESRFLDHLYLAQASGRNQQRAIETGDADRWERLFDETVRSGKFLYAVTFFITVGIRT